MHIVRGRIKQLQDDTVLHERTSSIADASEYTLIS